MPKKTTKKKTTRASRPRATTERPPPPLGERPGAEAMARIRARMLRGR